jgi:hypothetical protein
MMGWVGRPGRHGRFVDVVHFEPETAVLRLLKWEMKRLSGPPAFGGNPTHARASRRTSVSSSTS